MKKILCCAVLVAVVLPMAVRADTIEVTGQGADRNAAIKDALYQAVSQVRGVKVSSGEYKLGFGAGGISVNDEKNTYEVKFNEVSAETSGTVSLTQTQGFVSKYEILSERQVSEKVYEVKLKVEVPKFRDLDESRRPKIAVMSPNTMNGLYQFGEKSVGAGELASQLSQKITESLAETNKFSVLDREYTAEFLKEKKLIWNDGSPEEQVKIGEALGADYLFAGTISRMGIEVEQSGSMITGTTLKQYKAKCVFEWRIVGGSTRRVKLAGTTNISLDTTDEVKRLVKEWKGDKSDFDEARQNFVYMVAREVVKDVIDKLYPVRVAAVEANGGVIINQGGGKLRQGQQFEIFSEGKEILDADTNESLGKTEEYVATAEINRVTPKFSYAKVVKGDAAKVATGQICRMLKAAEPNLPYKTSTIEQTGSGGVKMPFDK